MVACADEMYHYLRQCNLKFFHPCVTDCKPKSCDVKWSKYFQEMMIWAINLIDAILFAAVGWVFKSWMTWYQKKKGEDGL